MAIDSAKFLGRSSDTATLSNKSVENISTIASTLIDVNTICLLYTSPSPRD